MRFGFYPRLAWDGMRKNKRLYIPYLITCVCMVMMHYIIDFLSSPYAASLLPRGADSTVMLMTLGRYVILLFSLIFLYYTNSFLIRRRKKEFGLYNVLGMSKSNLARIITWESLISAVSTLIVGLLLGILLSKIAELGLMNMLGGEINYRFMVIPKAVSDTALYFAVIYFIIWLASVVRVRANSAVSLMKSENVGEKAPKCNWLLGILGIVLLGFAYYLAVSISNPLDAVIYFFIAVLMVIVATYLIMVSGSVLLCRILQRNKNYYYQPRHFVSVSSMVYRMKRNGAGLASICIIATMVLVMISSSSCLYIGAEDAIAIHAPRDQNISIRFNEVEDISDDNLNLFRTATDVFLRGKGIQARNSRDVTYVNMTGQMEEAVAQCDYETVHGTYSFGDLRDLFFISQAEYNRLTGEMLDLKPGEAAMLTTDCSFKDDSITIAVGDVSETLKVVSVKKDKIMHGEQNSMIAALTLIVPDLAETTAPLQICDSEGTYMMSICWDFGFDTDLEDAEQEALADEWAEYLNQLELNEHQTYRTMSWSSKVNAHNDFYGANGGLFFIGILLSIVFLFAAVLIIYYKQISEGYEDQARFDIMQKVGMTKKEIRRSINSQLLTVFYLPLVFAGLHLGFAFPMIRKLLTLFSLYNLPLFIGTTVGSFVLFALLYMVIYKITSNAYFNIVSSEDPHE